MSPLIETARRTATAVYDFAVDGGVVGDIALRGQKIPSGAIITDVLIDVETILGSGGSATAALKAESAADLQSQAAFGSAPWSTATAKRGTLDADTAPVKTTAERSVVLTVGTANLNAGKFTVVVSYVQKAG